MSKEQNLTKQRVRRRALHLLEQQDRTENNLREKLAKSDYPQELVEDAVEYVKSYGYIDDWRYASRYVRYHGIDKSRRYVYQELLKRGVDRDTARRAIEECYEGDEGEQIAALLRKREYDPETADEKERQRTYAFLMRRGFESSDVLSALEKKHDK